jgi:hypothetical protein
MCSKKCVAYGACPEPATIIAHAAITHCAQEMTNFHRALRMRLNGAPNLERMIADLDDHVLKTVSGVVVYWRAEALQ